MSRPSTGRTSWVRTSVLVALVASLSACTEGSAPTDSRAAPVSYGAPDHVASAAEPLATRTRIHRVHGRLPDARRRAVRRDVGRVVDRWWEASYVGGAYPRTSFPDAFPGFTHGATRVARMDKALLTNQTSGARVESVTPRKRSISIDILATRGRARSVTARFLLRFDTTGDKTGTTTVRGRLFLTRRNGPWRVFGYDVVKGSRP